MKVIFKYDVPIIGIFRISIPQGAQLLDVDMQPDGPKLWALVDPDNPHTSRKFLLRGTGFPFADLDDVEVKYVGTLQDKQLKEVWHLFDMGEES